MIDKFLKEQNIVLKAAKKGIKSNFKLSHIQKKYVKNLLLFALINAKANQSVTNRNFIKLVNKLFKEFLLKIIKDNDEDDIDEELKVELNNIIASQKLLAIKDLQQIFTPEKICSFLKNNTTGKISQKELLNRLTSLRLAKSNYRETPNEEEKRKKRMREYELMHQRQRMMQNQNVHS